MNHLPTSSPARQRGVVLLFSLIALVVLLLAAVALMRSFNTSQFMAGNIAFKRDLQNQGERAVDRVLTSFRAGNALATVASRSADLASSNYSASALPVNAQGVPNVLVAANFGTLWTAPVIDATTDSALVGQGVSIRYIVDRLCTTAGDEKSLGAASCTIKSDVPTPSGGSASEVISAGRAPGTTPGTATPPPVQQQGVVYRLTIRVDGPRNTQAFFQSTFTIPTT